MKHLFTLIFVFVLLSCDNDEPAPILSPVGVWVFSNSEISGEFEIISSGSQYTLKTGGKYTFKDHDSHVSELGDVFLNVDNNVIESIYLSGQGTYIQFKSTKLGSSSATSREQVFTPCSGGCSARQTYDLVLTKK